MIQNNSKQTKSIGWGLRVIILISAFLILTLALVFFAFSQKVDLVESDYYAKGLDYQNHIDESANYSKLQSPIEYNSLGKTLQIKVPLKELGTIVSGKVKLYRLSDSRSDFESQLSTDSLGIQLISFGEKAFSIWRASIEFKAKLNDSVKSYYSEKTFRYTPAGIEKY